MHNKEHDDCICVLDCVCEASPQIIQVTELDLSAMFVVLVPLGVCFMNMSDK